MKIEPGYYKTRGGKKARVLCADLPQHKPVMGYMDPYGGVWDFWFADGSASEFDHRDKDLIEPWTEPAKLVPWHRVKAVRYPEKHRTQRNWIFPVQDWFRTEEEARKVVDPHSCGGEFIFETMEAPE